MLAALVLQGCAAHPPIVKAPPSTRPVVVVLCAPTWDEVLQSRVDPPIGWKPDPLKVTNKSRHRVWLSPTGSTAYGVIFFDLPLPVGVGMAYNGFINGMKQTSGEAIVLSKTEDDKGVHFVADGGLYRIRCNLSVSGFHGWTVYAGSLRASPVNNDELKIAEQARDQTQVGR